jgi:hypothetical protein
MWNGIFCKAIEHLIYALVHKNRGELEFHPFFRILNKHLAAQVHLN